MWIRWIRIQIRNTAGRYLHLCRPGRPRSSRGCPGWPGQLSQCRRQTAACSRSLFPLFPAGLKDEKQQIEVKQKQQTEGKQKQQTEVKQKQQTEVKQKQQTEVNQKQQTEVKQKIASKVKKISHICVRSCGFNYREKGKLRPRRWVKIKTETIALTA